MTTSTTEERPINYLVQFVGHLGHDNVLFDRTCPACKGMHSSYERSNCPKCGQALTWITSKDGTPMAISEGTVYPIFGKNQIARDLESVLLRKNGMRTTRRFKIFGFMENGVLPPPIGHEMMKKGSQIKMRIVNHPEIPSWYEGKDGVYVEMLYQIFPQYGDQIAVIAGKPAQANTDRVPTTKEGIPLPPPPHNVGASLPNTAAPAEDINVLKARIAALEASRAPVTELGADDVVVIENGPITHEQRVNAAKDGNEVAPFESELTAGAPAGIMDPLA